MKLNAVIVTQTTLLLITLAILTSHRTPSLVLINLLPMACACLPRVPFSSDQGGRPFPWSLFGQRDNREDEPENAYDKQIEEKSQWTTSDWIERHKYALELHNVTTQDGYHLQLHRMPQPGQRPILLVHGLSTSSLSWVLMGPGKSLAFLLYDKHYDVWLANLRGSSPYARKHKHFNDSDADFWSFSFHEMGAYDLPAIIDHIRNESSFHQVMLIGHSQAFNAFLVLCSVHPEYNDRILFMQALAPIVELKNIVKFSKEDMKKITKFIKTKTKSKSYELLAAGYLREQCLERNSDERKECLRNTRHFAGSGQYDKSLDPIIYGQLLQGGSLKEIKHLQQIYESGDFVAFDYGPVDNVQYYNSVNPYNYNLKSITVPVILHFGDTDAMATPAGVHRIYSRLLDSVIGCYRVVAEKFNHLDFLCASNVKTLINDKVIELMEKYMAGRLLYVIE